MPSLEERARRKAMLVNYLEEGDSAKIADWLEENITSPFEADETLFFIAFFAAKVINQITAPHRNPDEGGTWELESTCENGTSQRLAHQMISTALNEDIDTLSALVTTAVPKTDSAAEWEFFFAVLNTLFGFARFALREHSKERGDDA